MVVFYFNASGPRQRKIPEPAISVEYEFIENKDLTSIQTPVKVDELERLLRETDYDENEIEFLVKGFREGFDIGYEGPTDRCDLSNNIPIKEVGSHDEMWVKIMKEVKLNRYAGPFDEVPYKFFMQSPIGLVPKAGNKTRLIFHLSYNFKQSGLPSLNVATPKHKCSVKYPDMDWVIQTCFALEAIEENLPIFFAKTDVQSAFSILPLNPNSYPWLILKAVNPATGKISIFRGEMSPIWSKY